MLHNARETLKYLKLLKYLNLTARHLYEKDISYEVAIYDVNCSKFT